MKDFTGCRAGLYIRLSREDQQEGPSQSIQNQLSLLEEYTRRWSIPVYDRYTDDGWSGTDFDRPAFQRMLRDIEKGHVNLVLTKDLSRLGRDYILTGHYMERYFPEHGVRYISLLDGVDTGVESSANDITPFRAIMNDMYAKDISKKIKAVKHDKQKKGLFIGGKPVYGYQMDPEVRNHIIPDPQAAAVVRRIFHSACAGETCAAIATALNCEGIPCPSVYGGLRPQGAWSPERIREILRNETYLGTMIQGRSVKVSYKSKKCRRQPPSAWSVVPDTHQALIDRETFEDAGHQLSARAHTRTGAREFLLKGIVHCGDCGRPLGVTLRRNAAGQEVLYLICRTRQRHKDACPGLTVRENLVTEAVVSQVEALCGDLVPAEQRSLLRNQTVLRQLVARALVFRDGTLCLEFSCREPEGFSPAPEGGIPH